MVVCLSLSDKQTATCPGGKTRSYTSGFVGSREVGRYYPMFGRFEIRARVPHAQGLWPAFWLRHRSGTPGSPEVDILEYFHSQRPGYGSAALHLDGKYNVLNKHTYFESPKVSAGFHTWAVEISQASTGIKFEFFMDEKSYGSYIDTQANWSKTVDRNATWDIAVNQAVGGNWAGDPDGTLGYLSNLNRCSIGGTAPSGCLTTGINRVNWNANEIQNAYLIDYVRVYTR